MGSGIVYLIGAGPGNPKLITVRGLECLRKADVVVYDRLGAPRLLREARADAELIYVGKASSNHAMRQEEINMVLVRKAAEGKTVARLKGGDPFVFGRGGEEADTLVDHGIPFEVVPGVTSAISAPAFAGIPVTHRTCTSSFAVVTGHEDPVKGRSSIDWSKISTGVGTIVFLMGLANLDTIVRRLLEHGRTPDTPVGVVQWGSLIHQRTVTGTLATIRGEVDRAGLTSPVVIVVGEVVGLRERLRWFDNRPLHGHRVAVLRGWDHAADLAEQVERQGGEVIDIPVIHDVVPADRTVARLREAHGVIITSPQGVDRLFARLDALGLDLRALAGPKLLAVGPRTAEALRERGIRPDFVNDCPGFLLQTLGDESVTIACLDQETARTAMALGIDVSLVASVPTAAAFCKELSGYLPAQEHEEELLVAALAD